MSSLDSIGTYLLRMLPHMAVTVVVVGAIRLIRWNSRRRRMFKSSPYHEFGFIVFCAYIAGIIAVTFPRLLIADGRLQFAKITEERRLNYIPLDSLVDAVKNWMSGDFTYFLINIVGNIAVFMPIGFMLALLWRRFENVKMVFLFGFCFSTFIEVCQYFLHRGSDIDDIILNTLGCVLGYVVYLLVRKISRRFVWLFKPAR